MATEPWDIIEKELKEEVPLDVSHKIQPVLYFSHESGTETSDLFNTFNCTRMLLKHVTLLKKKLMRASMKETEAEARKNMVGIALAPVCLSQKVGDLTGGSQEDDEEQNEGITGITTKAGEEDEKSDPNSSFIFLQLCTLAVSSFLLCFVTLQPKFGKKKAAIPAVGLLTAALASRISLEIMPKRPLFARSCGFLAVLSLIVALASFIFSLVLCLIN